MAGVSRAFGIGAFDGLGHLFVTLRQGRCSTRCVFAAAHAMRVVLKVLLL